MMMTHISLLEILDDYGGLLMYILLVKAFPYSEPYNNKFNYIRNPFKAVVDAYNGTVSFYVWDEQ